jgi:pantetheine-phosphate adenylyltransferase
VFDRPAKQLLFSPEERIDLFRRAMDGTPNVEVVGYHGLTIHFARQQRARCIVRGLRASADFDYEAQMTSMNRHLEPRVDTLYLLTSVEHAFLSSSLVKEVAGHGASLAGLLPDVAAEALLRRLGRED